MAAHVLSPKPTVALSATSTCTTRKRGVMWRDDNTTRVFGQVWEVPRYRGGVKPSEPPRGRPFTQIVEAATQTLKAQLRGTAMRHASTALITRHVRRELRVEDPTLSPATVALVAPAVEAVRARLCEPWS